MEYNTKLSVLGSIAHSLFTVCDVSNLPHYEDIYNLTLKARVHQKAEFEPDLLKAWDELAQQVIRESKI
ncbi:hypothetical protein [Cytobacillus sp. FSL R5-0596]|uniref:hypothetical protein n=1 Tax=Cytobacillus sp. FSL R5-0596 TaxID=2954696 RepID=UPI0030F4DCB2